MATNLLAALPGAASPVDSFNQGRNNALLGQAMTASPDQRNNLLGQVAMTDPRQASAFKDEYAQQDQQEQANQDARMKKIAGAANYVLNAYKSGNPAQVQGAYQAVKPFLAQLGQEHGMVPPDQFSDDMLPQLYQIIGQAGGDTAVNGQVPTGLRELQGQIAGAGLTAGSPEAQKAYRVALGLDPRAVTGATKTGMITGADGRQRPYTFDPSTGRYSVFDGGAWQPLGAQESAQLDAAGAGGTMMGNPSTGSMPKPTVAALMQQATQMANQGGPGKNQAAAQQWLYGQLDQYGYRPATSTTAGLGVGRAPEDTARATQDAKNASDLAYLPQTEAVKTQADIARAGGTTTAKGQAERELEQPAAQASMRDAESNLDRMAQAAQDLINHPGLNGITSWKASIPDVPGSAAADARAQLTTLKSQIGFSVLQAMRNASKTGGALGSVSDAEGVRLENNLAALENSQSTQAFRDNLQKIIDYAQGSKGRLSTAYNQTYSGKQASAGQAQHPMPNTQADYDALPSGSLYVDPDDGKTYRKP